MKKLILTAAVLLSFLFVLHAQEEDRTIWTKDGRTLGPRRAFVAQCKKGVWCAGRQSTCNKDLRVSNKLVEQKVYHEADKSVR